MPKVSDHFDGQNFFNPYLSGPRKSWDILYWMLTRKPIPWPKSYHLQQHKIQSQRVAEGELQVTFINHSTLLIQIDGLNILTDPIWSKRASPFRWLGPKRIGLPGIKLQDLPPIDYVLISHNHYDHMDIPTLKTLQQIHAPLIFTGLGNKHYLNRCGIKNVEEFDWWESTTLLNKNKLTYVPAQHFSARGLLDRDKTLWGGFTLQGSKHLIYFAGDTGYGPHFNEIRSRIGVPHLSLLPIGAYKPEWFMQPVHMSPKEAVKALKDLGSKHAIAIHFGTFQLSDEKIHDPFEELNLALKEYQLSPEHFIVLNPGEVRKFS
ncbi:MAG: MBL fold metallo-hydrolase [Parachlamydiaceae bacterium]|nr:MBL fold metallo-hydrolase [Parachlamydiaceae bacterium]